MNSDSVPARGEGPLDLVRRLDARVVVPAALLVLVGLGAVGASKATFVGAQFRWFGVSFALVLAVMLVPFRRLLDLAWPLWTLSTAMLAAVLVFGMVRNGARRWIDLGFSIQPSEFAKVTQVLVLARYIRFRRDHRTFKGLFVPFLITLVPTLLTLKEPDLGTAAMFVPLLFAMLWVAGARTKHLLAVVALGVASLPFLYIAMPADSYQKQRIHAFLPFLAQVDRKDGASPRQPDTMQRDEAIAAVASGGIAGRSLAEPPQHERVPYSWTDFAFVVHAEEWGFLGVAAVLGLFAALLGGLAMFAAEVKEPAGRLLCVGALVVIGTQTLVNIAMTMGLAPVTGVPLPFVSYGGSSMLSAWLLLALALNAKARQPVVFSVGDFD